jgi:cytochrome c-type biogenesis protein CcmH/NrfG
MEDPPKAEEWEALAEAAKRSGKEHYSTDALRHAERGGS